MARLGRRGSDGGDRAAQFKVARRGSKASAEARSDISAKRAQDLAAVIADLRANGAASLRQIAAGLTAREIS